MTSDVVIEIHDSDSDNVINDDDDHVIEIDDSDCEIVCVRPVPRPQNRADEVNDEVQFVAYKPPPLLPSSRDAFRIEKRRRSPSRGILRQQQQQQQQTATPKKAKFHRTPVDHPKHLAVRETGLSRLSRFTSVRSDSNDARPLKKSSSSSLMTTDIIATSSIEHNNNKQPIIDGNSSSSSRRSSSSSVGCLKPKSILRTKVPTTFPPPTINNRQQFNDISPVLVDSIVRHTAQKEPSTTTPVPNSSPTANRHSPIPQPLVDHRRNQFETVDSGDASRPSTVPLVNHSMQVSNDAGRSRLHHSTQTQPVARSEASAMLIVTDHTAAIRSPSSPMTHQHVQRLSDVEDNICSQHRSTHDDDDDNSNSQDDPPTVARIPAASCKNTTDSQQPIPPPRGSHCFEQFTDTGNARLPSKSTRRIEATDRKRPRIAPKPQPLVNQHKQLSIDDNDNDMDSSILNHKPVHDIKNQPKIEFPTDSDRMQLTNTDNFSRLPSKSTPEMQRQPKIAHVTYADRTIRPPTSPLVNHNKQTNDVGQSPSVSTVHSTEESLDASTDSDSSIRPQTPPQEHHCGAQSICNESSVPVHTTTHSVRRPPEVALADAEFIIRQQQRNHTPNNYVSHATNTFLRPLLEHFGQRSQEFERSSDSDCASQRDDDSDSTFRPPIPMLDNQTSHSTDSDSLSMWPISKDSDLDQVSKELQRITDSYSSERRLPTDHLSETKCVMLHPPISEILCNELQEHAPSEVVPTNESGRTIRPPELPIHVRPLHHTDIEGKHPHDVVLATSNNILVNDRVQHTSNDISLPCPIIEDVDTVQQKIELDPETDRELPATLVSIPHLSRKSMNKKTNLPTWKFSLYGEDDSILYSFRAFAARSKIPGAGVGAFLEFTGAKRLLKRSNERRLRLLDQLDHVELETMQPLQAYPEVGGSGVTVYLKGKNLHGNGNREFQLRKLIASISKDSKLWQAGFKKRNATLRLISEDDLQLDLEYNAYYVDDRSLLHSIGHQKVQTDCDYFSDCTVKEFSTDFNCIDLGRYGPVEKQNRKCEDYFVLKSFIFSQVPSEWSFAAVETLDGMQQIIDITDDVTGNVSDLAKKEIPIYVNEVGFNAAVPQNVFIKDSDDDRSIRYFFKADSPLRKGEPIELLTNYKSAYEQIRERKGYGRSNFQNGEKSDSCRATLLRRNVIEREDVEDVIFGCNSIQRLSKLVQVIEKDIYSPLLEVLRKGNTSSLQLVAIRRVHWIVKLFQQMVRNDRIIPVNNLLNKMEKMFIDHALPILQKDPIYVTNRSNFNEEMMVDIDFEFMEEIYYPVRQQLPYMLDTSRYCSIAVRLTRSFCRAIISGVTLRKTEQSKEAASIELFHKFSEYVFQAKRELCEKHQQSNEMNCNDMNVMQVVVIVDVFASIYLTGCDYSLAYLCRVLNVHFDRATSVKKLGIKTVLYQPRPYIPVPVESTKKAKDCKKQIDLLQNYPLQSTKSRVECIYSGPPISKFPIEGRDWPKGWTQEQFKRASGISVNHIDSYWRPPEGRPKLRSGVEIRRYFGMLS